MKNKIKKTLHIDLDGVLNQYKGYYTPDNIPPLLDGAKEFLEKISAEYNIKIFTTRDVILVEEWVKKYRINKYISGITNKKEVAWAYIDDRCIKFNGDFNSLKEDLNNFEPWWKNKKTDF